MNQQQQQLTSPMLRIPPTNTNLTLASLNARQSPASDDILDINIDNTPLLYPRTWDVDCALDLTGATTHPMAGTAAAHPQPLHQYDFQSNSVFNPGNSPTHNSFPIHHQAGPSNLTSTGLAGLGIQLQCPGHHQDPHHHKSSFSPKTYLPDPGDQYISFSPRIESTYSSFGGGAVPPLGVDDLAHGGEDMSTIWPLLDPSTSGSVDLDLGPLGLDTMSTTVPIVPPPASSMASGSGSTGGGSSDEDLSIESLSAAAGLSVEEFTAKITEGAQYALKHLAEMESGLSDGTGSTSLDPLAMSMSMSAQDLYFDNTIPSLDALAPFPDFGGLPEPEMWSLQQTCLGINPADVMPGPVLSSTVSSLDDMFSGSLDYTANRLDEQQATAPISEFSMHANAFNPDGTISMPLSALAAPTRSSRYEPNNAHPHRHQHYRAQKQVGLGFGQASTKPDDGDQLSDYEPPAFLSPSSSEYSPSFGTTRQFQTRTTRTNKRKVAQNEVVEPKPPVATSSKDTSDHLPPIDLGSPVFDAHRGIELEDLKARAERYRLRNQGREYDKRWLLSFAGKLSNKGELIEEFRCYVVGCQQVNKRRDHILIHVGAHLDQRPFKCIHCSARFLRKNECKRHELSHTGVRPFTCNICPYPGTTFVRQDLLRRHMKRTHQVDEEKENNKPSTSTMSFRPRKKVKSF
ncbi:hypothetical protein CC1G_00038 [Coprinopsis cinerea okayama7|uniref:C2H2-type domain-containing protein n=1 Tax=Coprinopsis cinerea (strain Okayama-7 / 130 / ATCC MYA-4618 / FGSC 9003) TaxID=240176 RepID=A8NWI7_COPC7|nr:hypothetical protein CC1G_00038 [Coprinopsis cinerea okayama7\|eukprot:XP_001836902.2 hypothetical protein CC1G_00038 [Coprinopsis cinerea okayama7\